MATLGLVPPVRPLLPGEEPDPAAIEQPAPLNYTEPGQGTASPALQVVAPPATVDSVMDKGAQTNSTAPVVTPEHAAAVNDITEARARAAEADRKIADEAEAIARKQADQADQKAALEAKLAEERRQKAEEQQRLVDAAVAEEKQRRQAMEATSTMHSFWGEENRGAPARIFANVMSALADYAHLKAGGTGPSVASEYIEGEIAKDRQHKIDLFTRAKDFQQLAAHDVDKARDVLATQLQQFDAQAQVQRTKLTEMLEAQLARAKIVGAAAEGQKLRAASDMKNAESEAKARETIATRITKEGARRDTTHVDNATSSGAEKGKGDWTVFDEEGKPTRQGRSFEESKPLREQYAALKSAGEVAARLVELNKQRGRLPSLDLEQQTDQTISNLLEKKKAITGALNESDESRIKAKLKSGILGGADAANAAIGEFMQGMRDDYKARMNSGSVPVAGESAPAAKEPAKEAPKRAPAPKTPEGAKEVMEARKWLRDNPKAPAGQRARIQEWIRSHH